MTSRCGSLLPLLSADVRSSDDVIAFEGQLRSLLEKESISAFEFASTGLPAALLHVLQDSAEPLAFDAGANVQLRIQLFREAFSTAVDGDAGAGAGAGAGTDRPNSADLLVRKLVELLQHVEKLPVLLHESPGSRHGLAVLSRQLRFQLKNHGDDDGLLDLSGRTFKMESLASVRTLERYLYRKVAKQWYEQDRASHGFVQHLKMGFQPTFAHTEDWDKNGIVYWLGTNGKTESEWSNPSANNLVYVTTSNEDAEEDSDTSERSLPFGSLNDVLSRASEATNCHTRDLKGSWIQLDLGINIIPNAYTLRHARGYTRSALRNWTFSVSNDAVRWTTLKDHVDDAALEEPGSSHTWTLCAPEGGAATAWRYVRITVTGPNAGGTTHYLSVSGFEVYGKIVGVVESPAGWYDDDTEASAGRGGGGTSAGRRGIDRGHSAFMRAIGIPMRSGSGGSSSSRSHSGGSGSGSRSNSNSNSTSLSQALSSLGNLGNLGAALGLDEDVLASSGMSSVAAALAAAASAAAAMDGPDADEFDLDDLEDAFDEDGAEEAAEFDDHLESVGRYAGGSSSRMSAVQRTARMNQARRASSWDDGKVLKREFSAMVPPFDPRPNRTSVADSRNLTVPPPGSPSESLLQMIPDDAQASGDAPKLSIFLVDGDSGEEVLLNPAQTIFRAVQQLSRNAKAVEKIWEPVYTIVYRASRPGDFAAGEGAHPYDTAHVDEMLGTAELPKSEVIQYLLRHGKKGWLKMWKLNQSAKAIEKNWNCRQLAAAYKDHVSLSTRQPSAQQHNFSSSSIGSFTGGGVGSLRGDDLSMSLDVIRSLTPSPKKRNQPVDRMLQSLRRSNLPERGDVTSDVKARTAQLVHDAAQSDPTGSVAGFLRSLEWNLDAEPAMHPQQSPRSWVRLQTEAWDRVQGLIGGRAGSEEDEDDVGGAGSDDRVDGEGADQAALVLQLIRRIYDISQESGAAGTDPAAAAPRFAVTPGAFVSHKLNSKLRQQLRDPLLLASDALPAWCEELTSSCPPLFPLETRQLFFSCTAFGVSRTIAWLQKESSSAAGSASRPEFQVGRLTSERVLVPRGEQLLDWAFNVFRVHAGRKAMLDIEFKGEQGTGLGPTLEFYNLVAQELQRKDLCMWSCSDTLLPAGGDADGADAGDGADPAAYSADAGDAGGDAADSSRPPDYYVTNRHGLFPVALPRGADHFHDVLERFHFLGTFVAKSLQDSRLVALPLSISMFKVMCGHALVLQDLAEIVPEKAAFLMELQGLLAQKRNIDAEVGLDPAERLRRYEQLMLGGRGGEGVAAVPDSQYRLEDLALTFVYQPTSHVSGYPEVTVVDEDGDTFTERLHELREGGVSEHVTLENADEYVQLTTEFVLGSGVSVGVGVFDVFDVFNVFRVFNDSITWWARCF